MNTIEKVYLDVIQDVVAELAKVWIASGQSCEVAQIRPLLSIAPQELREQEQERAQEMDATVIGISAVDDANGNEANVNVNGPVDEDAVECAGSNSTTSRKSRNHTALIEIQSTNNVQNKLSKLEKLWYHKLSQTNAMADVQLLPSSRVSILNEKKRLRQSKRILLSKKKYRPGEEDEYLDDEFLRKRQHYIHVPLSFSSMNDEPITPQPSLSTRLSSLTHLLSLIASPSSIRAANAHSGHPYAYNFRQQSNDGVPVPAPRFRLMDGIDDRNATIGGELDTTEDILDDIEDQEADRIDNCGNLLVCQYSHIAHTKIQWRVKLIDGIMHVNGKDYWFEECPGEMKWLEDENLK